MEFLSNLFLGCFHISDWNFSFEPSIIIYKTDFHFNSWHSEFVGTYLAASFHTYQVTGTHIQRRESFWDIWLSKCLTADSAARSTFTKCCPPISANKIALGVSN